MINVLNFIKRCLNKVKEDGGFTSPKPILIRISKSNRFIYKKPFSKTNPFHKTIKQMEMVIIEPLYYLKNFTQLSHKYI